MVILFQVKLVEILNILYNCSFSAKTYPIKVIGGGIPHIESGPKTNISIEIFFLLILV